MQIQSRAFLFRPIFTRTTGGREKGVLVFLGKQRQRAKVGKCVDFLCLRLLYCVKRCR